MFERQKYQFRAYYSLFLRYKALFFVPFLVISAGAVAASFVVPKVYEAAATIRVQPQQPNPLGTGRLVNEDIQVLVRTVEEMVRSRPLVVEAIRRLHLDAEIADNRERERLIASIRKRIRVRTKGPRVFAVAFQDRDPRRAKEMADTVVRLFIDQSLSQKREEAYSSVAFIEKQLAVYKKKLETSEEALRRFKEEHVGEMPGEQSASVLRLEQLRSELADTNMKLEEAVGRKRFVEKQLSSEAPMIVAFRSGEAATTEEKLRILQYQLSQLLANYTDKHPDVVRLRKEIERLRSAEAGPGPVGPPAGPEDLSTLSPMYQKLKEEYNSIKITIGTLRTKREFLKRKIAEVEKAVESIPLQEQQLVALRRDYNVNDKIYQMLLSKLEEARISKQLEFTRGGSRFHVIEPAVVPISPVKPNRLYFLAGGLLFGCAAGAGLIYLREYFDTSTRGVQEVEEVYGLPVLAAIPTVESDEERARRLRARWRWVYASVFVAVAGLGAAALFRYRSVLRAWIERVVS